MVTGGRSCPIAIPCNTVEPMTVDPFAGAPDFATLYGGATSPLSPRMASQLWTTAIYFADTYADADVSDLLRQELPPIARRMADDVWRERFVVCFEALATRLARAGSHRVSLRRAPARRWRCIWSSTRLRPG